MLGIPATRGVAAHTTESLMTETNAAGQVVTGRYTGPEGARDWRLYVPTSYDRARPPMLLVLLHGCTQNADDIARGSQMDRVAEEQGFLVLYPEQPASANPRTCWNWFDAAHQARGAGEPAIIAGLVADVMRSYPVDAHRVHLAGISAGAAMAGLVAVAYPERFATVTSSSGIAWRAAQNVGAAISVMQRGAGATLPSPDAMRIAMGTSARALPVLVIHGGTDAVVSVRNADEATTQWVGLHNLLGDGSAPLREQPERVGTDGGYTVRSTEWTSSSGTPLVTRIRIEELGHAWSGGSTTGTYTDPKGPDVSRLIAAFCARHRLP
jgi:poly(hydroxyalkanoate) depolymerase family esterase